MNCLHCNSTNIEEGITIGQTAEIGDIGPNFKRGIFVAVAPMYCDLCLDCGEIVRFYIKDSTDKKWLKK